VPPSRQPLKEIVPGRSIAMGLHTGAHFGLWVAVMVALPPALAMRDTLDADSILSGLQEKAKAVATPETAFEKLPSDSREAAKHSEADQQDNAVASASAKHSSAAIVAKQGELEQVCGDIKQCFCMKNTLYHMNNVCGWCESTQTAMTGTSSGPEDHEVPCNQWIWSHRDCPYLRCDEDWSWKAMFGLLGPPMFYTLAWGCAILYFTPTREVQKPATMQYKRTLENFAKGLTGERARKHKEPFQQYFPYKPRLSFLIGRLFGTAALQQVLGQSLKFGCFMSVFYTVLRLLPMVCDRLTFELVSSTLNEIKTLSGHLEVAVGFLFSFYALGRVSWWWEVISHCRSMQGRTHDLAMMIGGYSTVKECPSEGGGTDTKATWLDAKWNFFRHLMLAWLLCFRGLSPDFGTVTLEDIQAAGLMNENESEIIQKSEHIRKVPLKWLAAWVEHYIEDMTVRALVMDKLCGLRGAMASLHDAVELRAPMSFEGLMYTLVMAWVTTIPFGRLKELDDRRVVLEENVLIPVFGAVCTYGFYISMVALLETFKQPFGTSRDSLNADTLILETETSVWDYMTAPSPDCFNGILIAERHKLSDESKPAEAQPGRAAQSGPSTEEVALDPQSGSHAQSND